MVLLGHALGDGVRELQEPVVELAEVAEDERLHDPVLVDEVALAPPDSVVQVVVTARAAASLRVPVGALRAGGPVDVVQLVAVLGVYGVGAAVQ